MSKDILENFTETEKKIIGLMHKNYNEERISKELNVSVDDVRMILDKYATIAFELDDLADGYNKENQSYNPSPLDFVEANGLVDYGGDYIKDGVYVDEGEGLPLNRKDFRSIFQKQITCLTPEEEEIYRLKTGVFDGKVKTTSEIATETGKTEAEVEKTLERINEKLREEK